MVESSNIIVVDGHTYAWQWQWDELVLMSETKDMVFIDAKKWFEDENRRIVSDYRLCDDYRGAEDYIWERMNDPDEIEEFIERYKDTATVINNYED
jgi:hypothetical protein